MKKFVFTNLIHKHEISSLSIPLFTTAKIREMSRTTNYDFRL